jgi:hypothetical protein
MSRSRRRTPIVGMTIADSDKSGKIIGHRRTRAAVRNAVASGVEDMPDYRLTENPCVYPKDGKQWIGDRHPALMRK